MKSFTQSLKSLVIALILVGGVSAVSAANTWTAPTVAAPNGNVDAPLNVSPITQFKKGGIVIEGLNASNEILAYPFSVLNGNVGVGTTTPRSKLSVIGTALANDFCIHDANGNSTGKCLSGSSSGTTGGTDGWIAVGLPINIMAAGGAQVSGVANVTSANLFNGASSVAASGYYSRIYKITAPAQCDNAEFAKFAYTINSQGLAIFDELVYLGNGSGLPDLVAGQKSVAAGGRDSPGITSGKFVVPLRKNVYTNQNLVWLGLVKNTAPNSSGQSMVLESCK